MNILERTIAAIAPGYAARRMFNKYKVAVLAENVRKYDAAANTRRTKGWISTSGDSNTEIAAATTMVRNRARDMVRNNPYARRAMKNVSSNVVGPGIRPSISGGRNEEKIKTAWKEWAETKECDFNRQRTIYGLQRLIMKSVFQSGEVFVRRVKNKKLNIPFQLQVLEADFLDSSRDGVEMPNGNYIQLGIEFNPDGQREAYWMFRQHPGANRVWKSLESYRVPASEILHVYDFDRPGQIRGMPFGTSSIIRAKDFDEYEDAQLIRQKIASCFAVFISGEDDLENFETDQDGEKLEKVEPGIIEYLAPNKQVHFANPPGVENYDEYARTTLRGVAAGYDVTYESLTGDLSNVNFSSGRMGKLDFAKFVTEWQDDLIVNMFCSDVWEWFLLAGELANRFTSKGITVTWTCPKMDIIDPQKEIKGMGEEVRYGFNSWQNTVRQMGRDPDQVRKELLEDKESFQKIGVTLLYDPANDANQKPNLASNDPATQKSEKK